MIPEVESRIAAGRIAEAPPLQLYQLRFLQGDGKNIVEIGDEFASLQGVKVSAASFDCRHETDDDVQQHPVGRHEVIEHFEQWRDENYVRNEFISTEVCLLIKWR